MSKSYARGFTEADVPDQSGKCFIVTGANSGIGFEVSRVLAARGARVLLACRDKAKTEAAMLKIRQLTASADLAFLPLDLADLASVRAAAELAANEPRIDALINNAGVLMPPLTRTKQGFEPQFGVNYLGHFALTALLLPKLAQTPGARVVITSSVAHRGGRIEWDDFKAEKSYKAYQRYADSKLACALFFFELDRRLRASGTPVAAVGCHPGTIATPLYQNSRINRILVWLMRPIINAPTMGAWPALQAATGKITPGGYYGPRGFAELSGPSGEVSLSRRAQDPDIAQRLWDVSVAMTGIASGLPPVK